MGRSTSTTVRRAPPDPMDVVAAGVRALGLGHEELFEEVVAALSTAPAEALADAITARLIEEAADAWERGWQPADLHRLVGRDVGARAAALLAEAVVEEAQRYRALGAHVAPRWMRQVDALADGTVAHLGDRQVAWVDDLVVGLQLLHALGRLPALEPVGPPPSAWHHGMPAPSGASPSDGVPDELRELLADLSSADSDATCVTRTAAAQALAARLRADRSTEAEAGAAPTPEVVRRRIGIDGPYPDAKAALLDGVCAANGARAAWDPRAGFATVSGLPADVDVVEALFGALLTQARAALRREGTKRDRYGRCRTTRFRRAFLESFARRTSAQLAAVASAALAGDPSGAALVPADVPGAETWIELTLFDDLVLSPSVSTPT